MIKYLKNGLKPKYCENKTFPVIHAITGLLFPLAFTDEMVYNVKRRGDTMKKIVPKRTIRRIENNDEDKELRTRKLELELASEADDEQWRELVQLYLDDIRILNSEDGEKIKRDFDRMMRGI